MEIYYNEWEDALDCIEPELERDVEGHDMMSAALAAGKADLIYEAACYVYETDNQRERDWKPDSPLQALAAEIITELEPYTTYADMGEHPPISAEDLNA